MSLLPGIEIKGLTGAAAYLKFYDEADFSSTTSGQVATETFTFRNPPMPTGTSTSDLPGFTIEDTSGNQGTIKYYSNLDLFPAPTDTTTVKYIDAYVYNTKNALRNATKVAINNLSTVGITASDGGNAWTMVLTQDSTGTAGNDNITNITDSAGVKFENDFVEEATLAFENGTDAGTTISHPTSTTSVRYVNLKPSGSPLSAAALATEAFNQVNNLTVSVTATNPSTGKITLTQDTAGADINGTPIAETSTTRSVFSNISSNSSALYNGGIDPGGLSFIPTSTVDKCSHGYMPYVPSFLDKDASPYAEISWTAAEGLDPNQVDIIQNIINNCTISYHNFHSSAPDDAKQAANYKHAMSLSASLVMKGSTFFTQDTQPDDFLGLRKPTCWVIQTKWETPTADFSASKVKTYDLSSNTTTLVADSPWKKRSWESYYTTPYFSTTRPSYLTSSQGMWHQYSSRASSRNTDPGYEISIEDVPGHPSDRSLAHLFASSGPQGRPPELTKKYPGRFKKKKISEAIVAVPYYIDEMEEGCEAKFFHINTKLLMRRARRENEQLELGKRSGQINAKTYDAMYNQPGTTDVNNVAYILRMMEKYYFPPQFDFVSFPEKQEDDSILCPFMYIFQFSATLNTQDLNSIWQNLYPSSINSTGVARKGVDSFEDVEMFRREINLGRTSNSDTAYVGHDLFTRNNMPMTSPYHINLQEKFINRDGVEVRWLVFKVKMKGPRFIDEVRIDSIEKASELQDKIQRIQPPHHLGQRDVEYIKGGLGTDIGKMDFRKGEAHRLPSWNPEGVHHLDAAKNFPYSYNWPYDFFSLIELAKIENKIDYLDEFETEY